MSLELKYTAKVALAVGLVGGGLLLGAFLYNRSQELPAPHVTTVVQMSERYLSHLNQRAEIISSRKTLEELAATHASRKIIQLSIPNCGPCRDYKSFLLRNLSSATEFEDYLVDYQHDPEGFALLNVELHAVGLPKFNAAPYHIGIKNGRISRKDSGYVSKEQLKAFAKN